MIDWLTIRAPFPHFQELSGGYVTSVDRDGSIQWRTQKAMQVKGSFSASVQIKSLPMGYSKTGDFPVDVMISGNPAKWFQGHNLWGTDDLHGLAICFLEDLAKKLGIPVSDETYDLWCRGKIEVTRVDCTQSIHMRNKQQVLSFIRQAENTAHMKHRGRGQLTGGSTLYFGKNSRRWSLKLYSKGEEIKKVGHGQQAILDLPDCIEWANRSLRIELCLRTMELQRLGLHTVAHWAQLSEHQGGYSNTHLDMLKDRLTGMTMTTIHELPPEVVEELTPTQQLAYTAWTTGADLQEMLSKSSFYRLRRILLDHGIDVASVKPAVVSNVIPLAQVLEMEPARIPDWAEGTPLYYEPRYFRLPDLNSVSG